MTRRESVAGGRRWRLAAILAVAALVAAGAGLATFRALFPPAPESTVPVLELAFPDVDGRELPLGRFRGKVVVLNFWATWCGPCREEIPEFVRLQAEMADQGVQFVGVAVDQADKVREFGTEFGVNYPLLIGGFEAIELSRALGNRLGALPFTAIVDRSGKVAQVRLGIYRKAELARIVAQLL